MKNLIWFKGYFRKSRDPFGDIVFDLWINRRIFIWRLWKQRIGLKIRIVGFWLKYNSPRKALGELFS
jgi:hypothetical protein